MCGAVFGHILKDIANTGFRFKRIDFRLSHTGIPTFCRINHIALPKITDLPPIKRATEKNGMIVHTMGRNTATFSSGLTIGKFDNEQVGKFNLTITVAFSDRILFTKARMFAKPKFSPVSPVWISIIFATSNSIGERETPYSTEF